MTPEEAGRERLLERIPSYVRERGIQGLRVDLVAAWLEMPIEQFRDYFESDADLISALVARNRLKLRDGYARMDADATLSQRERRKLMWDVYLGAAPDQELFFEAYGLAMHDETYGAFLHGVNDWLYLMLETLVRYGMSRSRATAFATLTLAVYRGAMLDYCSTHDRARVNAAMQRWFDFADRFDGLRS